MDRISAALRSLLVAAIALAMAACTNPSEPSRAGVPLAQTFETPDALARAVLDALARRDVAALRSMALSEAEFREYVWPELPVSRPERNVPFDYAWGQMNQRSEGSLGDTVGRYGGRPLRFVSTRFTGDTTTYQTFSVMRASEIVATDEGGKDLVLRLYGSALQKDGRYKLYSFVVD
ncbi:MAG TPA: hypothetical protein VNT81_15390 [Vicinamibacterales bacterium]|nr:hypothetical protein [Vicinamibacterales bacterium]